MGLEVSDGDAVELRVTEPEDVSVSEGVCVWLLVCVALDVRLGLGDPDGDGLRVAEGDDEELRVPLCVGVGLQAVFCAPMKTPGQTPEIVQDSPKLPDVQSPAGVPKPGTGVLPALLPTDSIHRADDEDPLRTTMEYQRRAVASSVHEDGSAT